MEKSTENEYNLIPAFRESIFENFSDTLLDLAEISIDTLIDDNIISAIPIVKTILGVRKTIKNIHDKNLLKQTLIFIKTLNSQTIDEENLNKYKKEIYANKEKQEEELGRILLILDTIKDKEKSILLAKFYLAYVNQEITWEKFSEYADVIERIFVSDINTIFELYKDTKDKEISIIQYEKYKVDRLIATGLLSMYSGSIKVRELANGNRETFEKNGFGELFSKIAQRGYII